MQFFVPKKFLPQKHNYFNKLPKMDDIELGEYEEFKVLYKFRMIV